MLRCILLAALLFFHLSTTGALAQSSAEAQALAAMSDQALARLPAKTVFGGQKRPTLNMKSRAIGSYAKGCMAGGMALPVDGPAWQVMRLSRNRNWGNPQLIALI